MSSETFFDELYSNIHQHPFLISGLTAYMASGQPVTPEQVRTFARLYYPHILRTRLYQANALGIAEDEEVQFVLADILYDEYGNGNRARTHMEVYRKLLRSLDIPESEISSGGEVIPELRMYIDSMMRMSQQGDWLQAAAAVGIASEWSIPEFYRKLLIGLRSVPGLTDDDLELFIGHIELDIVHSDMMRKALRPYAKTAHGRKQILTGVQINLDMRMVFLNGIYREMLASDTSFTKVVNG